MSPAGEVTTRVKGCVGHYKSGNAPCEAGQLTVGTGGTHKGCDKRARQLMATVHKQTNDGRVGYYTYGCTEVDGDYLVNMVGLVKVTDSNSTHDGYWG